MSGKVRPPGYRQHLIMGLFKAFCMLLAFFSPTAYSHDGRPIYVELNEIGQGSFALSWKAPLSLPPEKIPSILMPVQCQYDKDPGLQRLSDGYLVRNFYQCNNTLSGKTVSIVYPGANPALSTLFRVSLLNGQSYSQLLPPGENVFQVPETEKPWKIGPQYVAFGIEHIFSGIDHLLFVACLVFIAKTKKRILVTITGFTLAHSLTLVLSTLGIVTFPVPPVEAVIALSIVFLAHEIVVNNHHSWTWRYPVVVSSSFGLLHGFGFAAVLEDIGLPQTERVISLLSFNIGVEIGQIVFVMVLWVLLYGLSARILRGVHSGFEMFSQKSAGYLIGSVASFWMIQRVAAF
jgi:hydrogenase/urease accessory protein HupE